MNWAILDKRYGGLVLIMMVLAAIGISGLVARRPANSQSAAVGVVERYLDAKKNNDFTAWKSTLYVQ